jgi:hypothetical protein
MTITVAVDDVMRWRKRWDVGQIVGLSEVTRCRISSGQRGEKKLKAEERGKRRNQELLDQVLRLVIPVICRRQAASLSQRFNNMGLV